MGWVNNIFAILTGRSKKIFKVKNFEYNGFSGRDLPGYTPYTAEFVEWTQDPGIAKFLCSDGKTRLIPTFALERKNRYPRLPKQNYKKLGGKVFFGAPAHS